MIAIKNIYYMLSYAFQVLREQAPQCRVMVGGAVLNEEYAKIIGSDFYSRDAAGAATIAQRFFAGEIG